MNNDLSTYFTSLYCRWYSVINQVIISSFSTFMIIISLPVPMYSWEVRKHLDHMQARQMRRPRYVKGALSNPEINAIKN